MLKIKITYYRGRDDEVRVNLERLVFIEYVGLTKQILELTENQIVALNANKVAIDCMKQCIPYSAHIGEKLYVQVKWSIDYKTTFGGYGLFINLGVGNEIGTPLSYEQGITFNGPEAIIFFSILDYIKQFITK